MSLLHLFNNFLSSSFYTYQNIKCIALESTNTVLYRRAKLFYELISSIICKSLTKLIIYCNALIYVITLTFAMLANFNVTNAYILINANHAKKIFVNCLINRVQKDRYYLFSHDFTESTRDIFN